MTLKSAQRITGLEIRLVPQAGKVGSAVTYAAYQEDVEMLEVHRMIFDYCRAVEPSYQRRDAQEYLHRVRGKLPKLRRQAEFFAENFRRISDHTNFQMAALSLRGVVAEIDAVLGQVVRSNPL